MTPWKIKLLYDGECPFCVKEVRWLRSRDRRGVLAFEDITAPVFDPAQYGLSREEVMGVMHGVLPDGRVLRRLDVFRHAYRQVGLGWLIAPTDWPLLRPAFDAFYRWFARHRVRLGGLFGRSCEAGKCDVRGPGQKPSE